MFNLMLVVARAGFWEVSGVVGGCPASAAKCHAGCSWALHVPWAHGLGTELLVAALFATPQAPATLPGLSLQVMNFIINELPLLRPCYLKHCPVKEVFGFVAACLLNGMW